MILRIGLRLLDYFENTGLFNISGSLESNSRKNVVSILIGKVE
jgi:hypothetical protein